MSRRVTRAPPADIGGFSRIIAQLGEESRERERREIAQLRREARAYRPSPKWSNERLLDAYVQHVQHVQQSYISVVARSRAWTRIAERGRAEILRRMKSSRGGSP